MARQSEDMQEVGRPTWGTSGLHVTVMSLLLYNLSCILHSYIAEIDQNADNLYVFLVICGLRPVKDPLYLVDAFSGM